MACFKPVLGNIFSYATTLYCISKVISACMAEFGTTNKQTAESKETADLTKNYNFSYHVTLYCVSKAISATIHKSSPEEEEEQ